MFHTMFKNIWEITQVCFNMSSQYEYQTFDFGFAVYVAEGFHYPVNGFATEFKPISLTVKLRHHAAHTNVRTRHHTYLYTCIHLCAL